VSDQDTRSDHVVQFLVLTRLLLPQIACTTPSLSRIFASSVAYRRTRRSHGSS
jgi:hypothetical protein